MDKIEIIMKTAKMLAEENRGEWTGDVHEFATASAQPLLRMENLCWW